MAIAVPSALPGFSSHPLAAGMLLRKYNRDRAEDNAARCPTETLPQSAGPSIQLWMRRHVEVNGLTSMVAQYYEDKQQAKVYSGHHKKIRRD